MKTPSISQLSLGFAVAVMLSACAEEMPKPAAVAVSSPPSTPRPAQSRVSTPPARPAINRGLLPGSTRDFQVNVGDRVLFAFDKSNLDDTARATLQKQAAWLSKYAAVTVVIQGNADERGTREYNLALGARRAAAVKEYLASLGVRSDRLTTISFGKERPVCEESNEACWAQNRRAVSALSNAAVSPDNVAMTN